MKKLWVLAGMALLLGITGCRKEEVTPVTTVTSDFTSKSVLVLDLTDLATDPASYENMLVQVTGQYSQLPAPSCSAVSHLPPATWVLGKAGVIVRAAGLEDIILPLAPDDLTVQVMGRWQRWDGLVGCGDTAVTSTIWYLQAERIVDPNPISRATLTPLGYVGQPEIITPANNNSTSIPSVILVTPIPNQSSTPKLLPTPSPTLKQQPTAIQTFTSSPRPTNSPTAQYSPLATPTATSLVSPVDSSVNDVPPTSTPWPTYTPLPNVTVNTSTPTATPTPTPGVINKGVLQFDKVVQPYLEANQTHQWKFTGLTGGIITLTLASSDDLDLEITLFNPEGTRVARQGDKAAGQTETISDQELTIHGDYVVQVHELDGIPGDYALLLMDISSPVMTFPGNLEYEDDVDIFLPVETTHVWHFWGDQGETISVYLNPDDEMDGILKIYRPGGIDSLLSENDANEEGGVEEATHYLDQTGFYSIVVSEFYGNSGNYSLKITND